MGAFRFACVSLIGAYTCVAVYALVLWSRERRARLPLGSAVHAIWSALFAASLLAVSHAPTLPLMQRAVTWRTLAGTGLMMSATYLCATIAGLPARPAVTVLGMAAGATLAVRSLGGTLTHDVVDVRPLVLLGESIFTPVRLQGPTYQVMAALTAAVALFAFYAAWRLWRTDRIVAAGLLVVSLAAVALAPDVSRFDARAMRGQLVMTGLQLVFVLLGMLIVARQHEAQAAEAVSAERLFRAMFDQTYQLVGILDRDGRIVDVNRAALAMLALPLESLRGRELPALDFWDDADIRDRLVAAVAAARDGLTSTLDVSVRSASGELRYVVLSLRPLRDEHGEVLHLLAEGRDVTDERTARHARSVIETQLQQAQKLEAVGQLAGGIAHEFNNLLTVIHGFAALLASTPEGAARRSDLLQVQTASERAMALTRQMLAFSHHAVVDEQVVDLDALVEHGVPMLQHLVGPRIGIELTLASHLPLVRLDPTQLERVLVNLVVNARDAMPDGGRLTIETRRLDPRVDAPLPTGGDGVVLTVADTGTGMAPDVRARLFEPFFTTKAPGRGTGLGLAVVDRVVRQAGGRVSVDSTPGQGTRFILAFPATDASVQAGRETAAIAHVRGHETVLIVDDEVAVRELAAAALAQHGFDVLQAGTPPEALAVAREHPGPIHLLLTDVVMPGGSALDIVEGLSGRQPRVRVLFMSGYPADEAVRRGIMAGTINFLQKPFTPSVLAVAVRRVLDDEAPVAGRREP